VRIAPPSKTVDYKSVVTLHNLCQHAHIGLTSGL